MSYSTFLSKSLTKPFIAVLTVLFIYAGCSEIPNTTNDAVLSGQEVHSELSSASHSSPNVVEVIARHEGDEYIFELSTDEIPTGWTTFRLINDSHSTHFAYLAQIPQNAKDGAVEDGAELLDYWIKHVTNPFQFFMDGLLPEKELNFENFPTKYEDTFFPPWFGEALPSGGPGFTSGMTTSETTVYLEEGEYIVECYVKNAVGDFHSYLGMIELLSVSDEFGDGEHQSPAYTQEVSISSENGIEFDRHIPAGEHTFKVTFEDQAVYEHLLGHDINLVTQGHGMSAPNKLNDWMNWMLPNGLESSSSSDLGPQKFLGGVQTILTPEMLAGEEKATAYFHVDLKPGRYIWVAEVPDPKSKGMMKAFTVSQGAGR
ncbi:MAG: hypothetical protein EA390_03680 [Balneolaceae bacterium]|nr:MAG: hypothetical protein EA390_03680 [Balneolaceae bacterium]